MNFGRRPSRSRRSSVSSSSSIAHAVVVHLDLHDVGLVGAEGRDRARVGRRLGDDHVARVDQRLAHEVDDLLAAGGDEHVLGVDVGMPSAAMTSAIASLVTAMPSVGAYCRARAASRWPRPCDMSAASDLGREGRGVGQPAGERDDLGALGDGHEVAHGRGLHDRACARRTGRRSARGRARRRMGAAERDTLPVGPARVGTCRPLQSCPLQARTDEAPLDILQGMGVATAAGSARSCPRCWPARWPPTTSASTSTAPSSPSWRVAGSWLLALVVALVATVVLRARSRRRPARRRWAASAIGLGALLFAGSLDDRHATWWPGDHRRRCVRAPRPAAATRSLLDRARARALRRRGRGGAAFYAEAAALLIAGCRILFPPRQRRSPSASSSGCWLGGRRREDEKYAGLRILR